MKYWKVLVAAAMVFTLSLLWGRGDGNDKTDPPPLLREPQIRW